MRRFAHLAQYLVKVLFGGWWNLWHDMWLDVGEQFGVDEGVLEPEDDNEWHHTEWADDLGVGPGFD